MNIDSPVLLTVRGTRIPKTLDDTRVLHNETAGSKQGIAAARELGDLSHKVYVPVTKAGGSEEDELLFVDFWMSVEGIGQFFSNAHVQEQGGKMFSKRDPVVWMPAKGAFSFNLPAAQGRNDRWLGIVRGLVKSPEICIDTYKKVLAPKLADARRRGQLSHEIYFRIDGKEPEMLGVDVWCDAEGMQEHYRSLSGFEAAYAGKPAMSVWQQAPGGFSEW